MIVLLIIVITRCVPPHGNTICACVQICCVLNYSTHALALGCVCVCVYVCVCVCVAHVCLCWV